jgi:hypothetical protein
MVIIIKPISAQLTKDKDMFGKSDPYCVIQVGQEKQQTKPHSGGGKSPQWMDTLQFQSQDSLMRVAVFDKDTFSDDLIGEGTVNLNQLFSNPNRTENEYVDLVHNGKSSGRLLLSMEYQGQPMGGNQGNWGNQGGNQGWGNNQGGNQGGWGNGPNQGGNQGWGGNQGGNQGWGNGPNQGGGNQGWGNGPNQGGGNQGGWGNGPNQGGGNQGWGNGPNQGGGNQGWGNNQGNQGWGNNQGNQGWGNNNGW